MLKSTSTVNHKTKQLRKLITRRSWNLGLSLLLTAAVIFLMSLATGRAQTFARGVFNYATARASGNNAPSITAGSKLSRTQGAGGSNATIANVSDTESSAADLIVTATNVPNGITVNSITNTNGVIKADVAADCTSAIGQNSIALTVTDEGGTTATASLTVNVMAASTATLGNYADASVTAGGSVTVTPDAAPAGATGITASASAGFNGTFAVNAETGEVMVTNASPAKTEAYTVTVQVTSGCVVTTKSFALTVNNTSDCNRASFALKRDQAIGRQPGAAAIGDFNNDGKQDLAFANYAENSVSIRFGNGNGEFNGTSEVKVGTNPMSVAVGDFNGDGNQDLAVANYNSNFVSVRLGDGAGEFTNASNVNVGLQPYSVAAGDFNRDGKLDLAVANSESNSVSIRLGDGAGCFMSAPDVNVSEYPTWVAVADFNNDGKQDFATANLSNSISVRLGDGNGGFDSTANINVGGAAISVAVGDFNDDGKEDLAAAIYPQDKVAIRLGDGEGNFNGTTDINVGSFPASIALGDFNGDGKQDFTTANLNSDNVSVRLGDGAGGFNGTTEVITGHSPQAVVVGDFNADGKQDLAAANSNDNTFSVLLSDCQAAGVLPSITSQPESVTATVGDFVSFTVAVDGLPEPFVQWQFSADGGESYSDIKGETNLTLSFMATGSQNGYRYRVTLINSEGTATSDSATLTVNKLASSATLISSQNPADFGQSLLFTATVMSDPQGGMIPTGTVQFMDGVNPISGCEAVSVDEGQAVCQTNALTVGSHTITASYNGDDNFNPATGELSDNPQVVNINPAPTLGNYADSSVIEGCRLVLAPDAAPSDNSRVVSVTGVASQGFTGSISVDAATGIVTITDSGAVGAYTVTLTATDDAAATAQTQFMLQVVAPPTAPAKYDFDGDRKTDIAFYRAAENEKDPSYWYILKSSDNTTQLIPFGRAGDVIVPGDYNGDGMTDVAVYQPSTNTWFTSLDPETNFGAMQWGSDGDIPAPGFYDADQKTDIAVFRPSEGNWYIVKSSGGTEVRHWGASGDKPVAADYDGDGLTDIAVWRQSASTWLIQQSKGGTTTVGWGLSTDVPVPADYDGDGKTDIAVFRPSTGIWYVQQSSNGLMKSDRWGQQGDVPVAGDYDHDGKADLAVYRPSTGAWYIFSTCPCALVNASFGSAQDIPVPSAFNPTVEP
ncbi:MAG: VCBS repeat-containing protein [Acidobacteria bacterium]|nr:VCBS repeat-containing protein [Acidobacteriota bacterium]